MKLLFDNLIMGLHKPIALWMVGSRSSQINFEFGVEILKFP